MLRHLASLEKLESLVLNYLDGEAFSDFDYGVTQLPTLPGLKHLGIDTKNVYSKLTGLSLEQFAKNFPQLESLDLGATALLYDLDLEHLQKLTELRELRIPSARVTGHGLMHLVDLPNLQTVVLNVDRADPDALKRFQRAAPHVSVQLESGLQRKPPALHFSRPQLVDADKTEVDAFWSGDFAKMARRLRQKIGTLRPAGNTRRTRSVWENLLWLGHSQRLGGKFQQAVATYQNALEELDRDIAAMPTRSSARYNDRVRQSMLDYRTGLVLMIGQLEMEELGNPEAAIKTLQRGMDFFPEGRQPLRTAAQETATLLASRKTPRDLDHVSNRLYVAGMRPMATLQLLANIYEQQGNIEAAVNCWTRLQLSDLAYNTSNPNIDMTHVASLWSKLDPSEPRPKMPVFLVVDQDNQEIVLEPASGQSRLASWSDHDWHTFAIIPAPGKAIAKLDLDCTVTGGQGKDPGQLNCWIGGRGGGSYHATKLLSHRWENDSSSENGRQQFTLDVKHDVPILFVQVPEDSSSRQVEKIVLRASLRSYGEGLALPAIERPVQKIQTAESPIDSEVIDLSLPGYESVRLDDAACVARPDGSWLMAFSDSKDLGRRSKPLKGPEIMLSTSLDGHRWAGVMEMLYPLFCC